MTWPPSPAHIPLLEVPFGHNVSPEAGVLAPAPDAARLLSLVAEALTACEAAGIAVKLKHGAVWTDHGYVFQVGERTWEPRTLAYTEFSGRTGDDED